jgi:hypothetical protein
MICVRGAWPGNPERTIPDGTYTMRVVAGDPGHFDSVFRLDVEGIATVSGTPPPRRAS